MHELEPYPHEELTDTLVKFYDLEHTASTARSDHTTEFTHEHRTLLAAIDTHEAHDPEAFFDIQDHAKAQIQPLLRKVAAEPHLAFYDSEEAGLLEKSVKVLAALTRTEAIKQGWSQEVYNLGGIMLDLSMCPECDRDFVYEVSIEEAGEDESGHLYELALCCAQCEWRETGIYPVAAIDYFDQQRELHRKSIETDCRWLETMALETAMDTFIAAAEADAIKPEDF